MANKNMGDILYSLLPQVYRTEDSKVKPTPYQLQRFLQVNSTGLDFLLDKIQGHADMYDLDRTPKELLPHIAKMLGFDFPYDMSEQEQRGMLKLLPTLYKLKGTATSFDYLARQIFGLDAKAYSDWVSRGGLNGENLIRINLELDGETKNLQTRIDRYYKYSETFRPVNNKLFWSILLHYSDNYNRYNRKDDYSLDKIFMDDDYFYSEDFQLNHLILNQNGFPMLKGDVYDASKIMDDLFDTFRSYDGEDLFSFKTREEEIAEKFNVIDLDIYNENKIITENFIDTLYINDDLYYGESELLLNKMRLNTTARFPLLQGEIYDKSKITELFFSDCYKDTSSDSYTATKLDEPIKEVINVLAETETYDKGKIAEDGIDKIYYDDNRNLDSNDVLNKFILNDTNMLTFGLQMESYNFSQIFEDAKDLLADLYEEVYNKSGISEEESRTFIRYTETDNYSKSKTDTHTDIGRSVLNALNTGILNSTMLLTKKPVVTTY